MKSVKHSKILISPRISILLWLNSKTKNFENIEWFIEIYPEDYFVNEEN